MSLGYVFLATLHQLYYSLDKLVFLRYIRDNKKKTCGGLLMAMMRIIMWRVMFGKIFWGLQEDFFWFAGKFNLLANYINANNSLYFEY